MERDVPVTCRFSEQGETLEQLLRQLLALENGEREQPWPPRG
ncbi:hypothetical protein [Lawsonibacter celer]|jgi:hypothetical protein|nr:hypothetical protein [Lawsonibacter celer]